MHKRVKLGVISVDFIGDSLSRFVTIWEIWGVNAMSGLTTSSKGSTWLHTWFQEQYAIKTKSNSFRASHSISACDSRNAELHKMNAVEKTAPTFASRTE